jgi:hypothetical protein
LAVCAAAKVCKWRRIELTKMEVEMPRWSRASFVLAFCAPWVLGQNAEVLKYPKIESFVGYSAIETNDHTFQFADVGPVGHLDYDEKSKGFEAAAIGI